MVKNLPFNAGDVGSVPGLGRFPWRRALQSNPVFLPGESHGQRSLVSYSPRGHEESDTTERRSTHACMPVTELLNQSHSKIKSEFTDQKLDILFKMIQGK